MKNIIPIVLLSIISYPLMAMDNCGDEVTIVTQGDDGRFSLEKMPRHTDWVKMRFIIGDDGSITDPKPIKFSRDLYINRAHKRIKRMTFKNSG